MIWLIFIAPFVLTLLLTLGATMTRRFHATQSTPNSENGFDTSRVSSLPAGAESKNSSFSHAREVGTPPSQPLFEHSRLLDVAVLEYLSQGIAVFDSGGRLWFFNQAFQRLWELEIAFLDSAPDYALVLDRLRSDGKLAEQPEWRQWKDNLLLGFRSAEPQDYWWFLPDQRRIRFLATPQPGGGVMWIFEDHTARIDLESRYNTAVRVQGETLDNLTEGVSVFGPDGRLRLANPAFASLWGVDPNIVLPGVHISTIKELCRPLAVDSPWSNFVGAATGFDDERRDSDGLVQLRSGSTLRYTLAHLPNGQVMLTFIDVTDSISIERALKERNEALEKADELKTEFVQHVSYELRSPLTNLIGFTELLRISLSGVTDEKPSEYLDHIRDSTDELRRLIDDIIDLATIDAGVMELDFKEIPVRRAVEEAAALAGPRFTEFRIHLDFDLRTAPASFHGDEQRVRQVLFNLLTNAANFAPEGSTVRMAARPWQDGVEFSVHDEGPGIPAEVLDTLFRRFEPRSGNRQRRGPGLGLSLVKSLVELHDGTVEIDTGTNRGTTVTVRFPRGNKARLRATG